MNSQLGGVLQEGREQAVLHKVAKPRAPLPAYLLIALTLKLPSLELLMFSVCTTPFRATYSVRSLLSTSGPPIWPNVLALTSALLQHTRSGFPHQCHSLAHSLQSLYPQTVVPVSPPPIPPPPFTSAGLLSGPQEVKKRPHTHPGQ